MGSVLKGHTVEFKTSLMVIVLVGASLVGCDNAAKDLATNLTSAAVTASEKPADRKEQAVAAAEAVIKGLLGGHPNEAQHHLLERALRPVLENQIANESNLFGGSLYDNSLRLQQRILKLVRSTDLIDQLKKLADEPAAE
jgi:hypothetical protein